MANTCKNKWISLQILLQWLCHFFPPKQNTFLFIIAITAVLREKKKGNKRHFNFPSLSDNSLEIPLKMINLLLSQRQAYDNSASSCVLCSVCSTQILPLNSTEQTSSKANRKPGPVSHQKPDCFLDQVFTTQTPPLTPAKEKQNTLLEHSEEEEWGEESLKDEMQKRTFQLTAKENEVRKSLNHRC